jgi:hypothetical protein
VTCALAPALGAGCAPGDAPRVGRVTRRLATAGTLVQAAEQATARCKLRQQHKRLVAARGRIGRARQLLRRGLSSACKAALAPQLDDLTSRLDTLMKGAVACAPLCTR